MLSQNYLSQLVKCDVIGAGGGLEAVATRNDDGSTLVLQVVNPTDKEVTAQIQLKGFIPGKSTAQVTELSGEYESVNPAAKTNSIVPTKSEWRDAVKEGQTSRVFPPYSFTVIRFE
jgi:alpha-L-arabinofuranosidase